ncbi:unnamed protein product [Linum trigynum]|uniref:Protein kinase domain-containing protein n=1 Tax=Linum trigynum TaxID=586398 RepID=A0AAV2CCY1_9ROSI
MLIIPPHPNILQIHEAFDSDDSLTLILNLCEPYTLYDKVIKSNGGLPEPKSTGIMRQLLEAVAHCHRFGVVHCDIKPDNVLFDSRNRVKLVNFGSVDWVLDSGSGSLLSGVYETPYYVAPEVLMGRVFRREGRCVERQRRFVCDALRDPAVLRRPEAGFWLAVHYVGWVPRGCAGGGHFCAGFRTQRDAGLCGDDTEGRGEQWG